MSTFLSNAQLPSSIITGSPGGRETQWPAEGSAAVSHEIAADDCSFAMIMTDSILSLQVIKRRAGLSPQAKITGHGGLLACAPSGVWSVRWLMIAL